MNKPVKHTKVTVPVWKSHQQSSPGTEEQQLIAGHDIKDGAE